MNYYGSIELSKIPKEMIKAIETNHGKGLYLNVRVVERREPSQYGHTHFISCAPKKEEQRQDVTSGYYIIGDLKPAEQSVITPEAVTAAQTAEQGDTDWLNPDKY